MRMARCPAATRSERLSRHLKIPFVVTVHGLDAFSSRQVSDGRVLRV